MTVGLPGNTFGESVKQYVTPIATGLRMAMIVNPAVIPRGPTLHDEGEYGGVPVILKSGSDVDRYTGLATSVKNMGIDLKTVIANGAEIRLMVAASSGTNAVLDLLDAGASTSVTVRALNAGTDGNSLRSLSQLMLLTLPCTSILR